MFATDFGRMQLAKKEPRKDLAALFLYVIVLIRDAL